MFGTYYYNQTIRRYVTLMGRLFSNIKLERSTTEGANTVTQTQDVPIAYAGREKFVARIQADPTLDRPVAAQYPRMAFELVNLTYDGERQLNAVQRRICFDGSGPYARFVPVPYNLHFNVYIAARYVEDALKVVEQIFPNFTPTFNMQADLLSDGHTYDVTLGINTVDIFDKYEGPIGERRVMIWTLGFTMSGWLFGNQGTEATGLRVIRWARVDSHVWNGGAIEPHQHTLSSNTYPYLAGTDLNDILPEDDYTVVTDWSEWFSDERSLTAATGVFEVTTIRPTMTEA